MVIEVKDDDSLGCLHCCYVHNRPMCMLQKCQSYYNNGIGIHFINVEPQALNIDAVSENIS